MLSITYGSDPEFGIVDIEGNPKSVVGYLGGTKKNPLSLGNGCSRQEDNVGAELTFPPVDNEDSFVNYIKIGRKAIDDILIEYNLKTIAASSLIYDPEELKSKEAMTFGCEASFDVYTGSTSERPSPEEVGNLRSFGFHIHVGWEGNKAINLIEDLVLTLDAYLALPSLFLDTDNQRRKIYGNPGDFRFTDYGFEYRTLGGSLLREEWIIRYIYRQTVRAIKDYNSGIYNPSMYMKEIYNSIVNNDLKKARILLKNLNINLPYEYYNNIRNSKTRRKAETIL
jgi:hypothetical protein